MSKKEKPKATPKKAVTPENEPLESTSEENGGASEVPTGKSPRIDMESVADGLAADLDSLQGELEEAKNRALRSSAELENFRRRSYRQMEEERRYANLDLFRELLPIWDNMGRAVDAAEKAGEADALLEGFKMVCTQLENVFERFHCVRIDAEGEPFDPNLHEAISQMPSADHPPGTVLHVAQIGFRLHDRVVRPCQVVVSAAPPTQQAAEKGGTGETPVGEEFKDNTEAQE